MIQSSCDMSSLVTQIINDVNIFEIKMQVLTPGILRSTSANSTCEALLHHEGGSKPTMYVHVGLKLKNLTKQS